MANRGDPRVINALLSTRIQPIEEDYRVNALIPAGISIGDPHLLPMLLKEREEWDEDDRSYQYQQLLAAIAHCLPETE